MTPLIKVLRNKLVQGQQNSKWNRREPGAERFEDHSKIRKIHKALIFSSTENSAQCNKGHLPNPKPRKSSRESEKEGSIDAENKPSRVRRSCNKDIHCFILLNIDKILVILE